MICFRCRMVVKASLVCEIALNVLEHCNIEQILDWIGDKLYLSIYVSALINVHGCLPTLTTTKLSFHDEILCPFH